MGSPSISILSEFLSTQGIVKKHVEWVFFPLNMFFDILIPFPLEVIL